MGTQTLEIKQTRDNFRAAVTRIALAEVGYGERPGNRTKYGLWYGMDGFPWCAMFDSWVYAQAAIQVNCQNPLTGLVTKKGFSHATTAFAKMKNRRWVLEPDEGLLPGDIVVWDHDTNPGGPGHTGIVVAVHKDGFDTVEGNTDPNYSRTGGNVMRHEHTLADHRHGFLLGFARPTRRYGR